MSDGSPFSRLLSLSFVIIFALCPVTIATAQSGRRATKSPATPATPPPLPDPTPVAPVTQEKPKPTLQLVVGIEKYDGFSNVSMNTYEGVLRSCAQQLDEPPSVSVERLEHPMSRTEVTKRAREEKVAYVVWLRLREDGMSANGTGTPNNAYIEYMVFAPITAKVIASGATYPKNRRINQGSGLPSPNGDPNFNDAARATANKILSALQLHIPPNVSD
ncbi:MAG TPA: hypothetical protein VGO56_02340 [Pyrinomonadaceae bacterium]|jgi:hypothetical protein|nr:hypothetical protein [Pyrinomonadaceae bacterium]